MDLKDDKKAKNWLISTLRRASYRWPARNESLKLARIERGLYQCAICKSAFKRDEVQLDHIVPVIPLTGTFSTWDEFINRLFCPVDGYQVICTTCHDSKTALEDSTRAMFNKKRKDEEKLKIKLDKKAKKE